MLHGFSDISSLTCTTRILLVNYLQLAQFSSGTSTKFKHCFVGFFFPGRQKGISLTEGEKQWVIKIKIKKGKFQKILKLFAIFQKRTRKIAYIKIAPNFSQVISI